MAAPLFPSILLVLLLAALCTLACVNLNVGTLTNIIDVGPYRLPRLKASPRLSDHIYLRQITSPTPQYGDAFELRVYNGDYMRNVVYFSLFEILPWEEGENKLAKLYKVVNQGSNETCVLNVFKQMVFDMQPWAHFTWYLYPASV